MIYFAQRVDGGPIKIGYSKSVDRRIRDMQIAMSVHLTVLAVADGDRANEARLHKKLWRHRVMGEWFLDCDDVRQEIVAIGRPFEDPAIRVPLERGQKNHPVLHDIVVRQFAAALKADKRSTRKIATAIGCSMRTVEHWKSGRGAPTMSWLLAVADAVPSVKRMLIDWLGQEKEMRLDLMRVAAASPYKERKIAHFIGGKPEEGDRA